MALKIELDISYIPQVITTNMMFYLSVTLLPLTAVQPLTAYDIVVMSSHLDYNKGRWHIKF